MSTKHWIGAIVIVILAFMGGVYYAKGKVTLP